MTLAEVKTLLLTTGLPVAYRFFEQAEMPSPPYIVFYESDSNILYADNKTYSIIKHIVVELVVKDKKPSLESLVETALANISYTKRETYVESEQATEIDYEIEV